MNGSQLVGLMIMSAVAWNAAGCAAAPQFFVAVDGSDTNPGTEAQPFASLEKARDALRSAGSRAGATVWVKPGVYPRSATFVLEEADSGTKQNPVVYRATVPGKARLQGGRQIPATAFRPAVGEAAARLPAEARGKVVVADLKALGIRGLKPLPPKFRGAIALPELYYNDRPLQLARWPNEGWVTIQKVIDRGREQGGRVLPNGARVYGIFEYADPRPARWNVAKGVWLHGYWCHDWYDEVLKVGAIDPQKRQIALAAPHSYGIGPSSEWNKEPRRYYAFNLLEELDAPGEYYLDAEAGLLYLWPPDNLADARVVISLLQEPLVRFRQAAHVLFRGFTLECCQGDAVVIEGGRGNQVAGCVIRNVGRDAVVVSGEENGVVGCDITQVGAGGVILDGGDRGTLTAARNFADNNHIYRFGQRARTYAPGVRLSGVGNGATHNLIHDCPHAAILYGGNDQLIEFNDIFNTCLETGDVGALYTGRDWGSQGNVVRYNFIHHTGGINGYSMGVYL
ncbi:MAG: right-handed parallel beta-helix repeat-containing protein, partial [Armatimonadota bacterium]|nr:right-handed parallel beta-helix repeat-containing protein [Armatimonadota bacterium]